MSNARPKASSPSVTQRWLDLLVVLVGQRYAVPINRIMEEVPAYRSRWMEGDETDRQSVRRMFERDKKGLRALGIPIESERLHPGGTRSGGAVSHAEPEGYRVRPHDFYLPYLRLIPVDGGSDEAAAPAAASTLHATGTVTLPESDVAAAVAALRTVLTLPSFPFEREARSALRKLTFDLDPALDLVGGAESRIRLLDRPGGADPAGVLDVLMGSLHDRTVVSARYRSIRGNEVKERSLEPWGLIFQWGSWYLVARDLTPQELVTTPPSDFEATVMRVFRIDRMSGARRLHPRVRAPDFEIPDDFDLREWVGRKPWELGVDEVEVEVLVHFRPPASLHAIRNGWGEAVEPEIPPAEPAGGQCHADRAAVSSEFRRFLVRRQEPFLRWMLSFRGEAHVVGPPELVTALDALARHVAAAHGEGGRGGAREDDA